MFPYNEYPNFTHWIQSPFPNDHHHSMGGLCQRSLENFARFCTNYKKIIMESKEKVHDYGILWANPGLTFYTWSILGSFVCAMFKCQIAVEDQIMFIRHLNVYDIIHPLFFGSWPPKFQPELLVESGSDHHQPTNQPTNEPTNQPASNAKHQNHANTWEAQMTRPFC